MQVTQEYHKLLKQFRKKAKMTQEQIAYELNITQSTVSKIESGRYFVDIKTFMNWVRVTNCEAQAAVMMFGADVLNNALTLLQMIPAFIGGVLWI
ncbi:helix-turn-helix domain-containing protein [Ureibacillus thermophilus]|uniref:XRE family transcriptional regulator n=1 Tax=Ureibacillus thermophilus TaxID=367743 RepID=A0A4P6UY29_9BACL|nr:helix-turn-helix transcriptional regulator [Ureibacillus thermophilus]QBK26712.1 XRE family transcriptional regulator [Ureibacillus thermophilus]